MFIRRSFAVFLVFISLFAQAQNKKPTPHFGSAPLSSSCVVRNLPADQPDTNFIMHPEPEEPGERDPRFFLHKRKLPNNSFPNFYEDQGRTILNKTNSGNLTIGATGTFGVYTQGTPPDNAMAISNAGKTVASINVRIGFYDSTGATLQSERNISTFIGDNQIAQSSLFDPRVLYDPKSDRFIYVVLSGSTDVTSKLIIGFSQTNDPIGAWKFYKINGNVDGSSNWFDYPNVGITDNELIITGNLFSSTNNSFYQSVVLQINKAEGYSGAANLNYRYWDNIQDGNNVNAFTLVPAGNSGNENYGPKFYLVSNTAPSSNIITIYEITDTWNSPSAQINIKTATVDLYSTPASDAQQKGTTRRLDIKKNRIRNAYYNNGIVHYTYITPTNSFGAVSAIAYGRFDVATETNKLIYIGETGFNYAFPAITHFSNLEKKNATLLTYLASNTTIYPEIRAVYIDENMLPSPSILVKAGNGYVNYGFGGNSERWGDYTGISRRYNSTKPEVWVFGCFGETTHYWGNFIAQITASPDIPPVLVSTDSVYFSPNPTLRYLDMNVSTKDSALFNLKIYSLKGQLVREEQIDIPSGIHTKTFDLMGLSPEEYILKLTKNGVEFKPFKFLLLGK